MEKEDKPKETPDNQTEGGTELTAAKDSEPVAPVVVKKTGGLSLLLALLALAASGYLLYRDWQQSQVVTDDSHQNQQLAMQQVLDQQLPSISQRLDQVEDTLDQQAQQLSALDNKLKQLRETTDNQVQDTSPAAESFDNSDNLALFAQLQNRLNEQNTQLQELRSKLANQANSPVTEAHEVLPDTDPYHTQATVESLLVADLLLQNGQFDQAVKGLEDHLATARVRPGIVSQINQLIGRVNRIVKPDTQALDARLQAIKQQLSAVGLATEAVDDSTGDENTPWYARFVSVKKISTDSQIKDSTALALVKAQISQHLFQAQLALRLTAQDMWSEQLQQAIQLLQTQLPDQQNITNELRQLSAEAVTVQLPSDIDIASIIDELNGLR